MSDQDLLRLLENVKLEPDGSFKDIEEAIRILDILVGFDTSSSYDIEFCRSNIAFVKTLQRTFEQLGLKCAYSEEDEYPPGSGTKHASLAAKIDPANHEFQKDPGGFVLSSHTDVIKAEGMWMGIIHSNCVGKAQKLLVAARWI